MTDKDNFEKRLLSELRQVSAENPAPAPQAETTRARPYGRFAAAGAGLAAVVAGIAIYTSTGDNTTSAYAVEKEPDGKVSVEIIDLTEADGLEESLAAAGVPAEVMPVSATVCAVEASSEDVPEGELKRTAPALTTTEPDGDAVKAVPALPALPTDSGRTAVPAGAPGVPVVIDLKESPKGASFSIDPDTIAEGEKVMIAPTEAKPAKLIPAGAPSTGSIDVTIGAPSTAPPC